MNASDLRDVVMSPEFKQDLEAISCFLASVKQERPIVYFLARLLWKKGCNLRLEDKHTDLVIDGKRFEFKFSYDADMTRLQKELDHAGNQLLKDVYLKPPKHGWVTLPRLFSDMANKGANVFVWIILSRDLSRLTADAQQGIALSKRQLRWNRHHAYLDQTYLETADQFVKKVQVEKNCSVIKESVETVGNFPSTYHFWFFDLHG